MLSMLDSIRNSKPKCEGGLGIRDLRVFNLALLGKWRWRLLSGGTSLWRDIIVARYGREVLRSSLLLEVPPPRFASIWWRDLCQLGSLGDAAGDWFRDRVVCRLGIGNSISFWHDIWVGHQPLRVVFPRLFSVSSHPDGVVADFGSFVGGGWVWGVQWRRRLFVWEEELLGQLLMVIQSSAPSSVDDSWVWLGDVSGVYSVRSAYVALSEEFGTALAIPEDRVEILSCLWRSLAPPKVIAFSWQLLLDRIPTRRNLLLRGVISDASLASCAICGDLEESSLHLFLRCPLAVAVWYDVFRWLGWQLPIPPDLFSLFDVFCAFGLGVRVRRGLSLIWHSVLWLIWDARNGHIFSGRIPDRDSVVGRVKSLSWRWFIERSSSSPCIYYEWHVAPVLCISRN